MTTIGKRGWMWVACAVAVAVCGSAWGVTPEKKKSSVKKPAVKTVKAAAKAAPGRASLPVRSADPCLGSLVMDVTTGTVISESNADAPGFPASVIKLMDMMVALDKIAAGELSLSNRVTVTREAAGVGGSQVYLAEKEEFSLEDLMYALMVQSANDAAVAIALHASGDKAGFVELMNRKAQSLGMTNTLFHSVHGLPPAAGQAGDTSTARDLAVLARALVTRHPEILKYTSTRVRQFRGEPKPFVMRSHNHLLESVPGCDGLKTGFINAGGFSIVVTAERNGRRIIAVVLGSRDRKVRDAQAAQLISKGFANLPPLPPPPPPPVVTNLPPPPPAEEESGRNFWLTIAGFGLVGGLVVLGVVGYVLKRRPAHDF